MWVTWRTNKQTHRIVDVNKFGVCFHCTWRIMMNGIKTGICTSDRRRKYSKWETSTRSTHGNLFVMCDTEWIASSMWKDCFVYQKEEKTKQIYSKEGS